MKPTYKVWYHPYTTPNETEFVYSYADNARDARFFARAFGYPFEVETIDWDVPERFY